jgi:hypothetical protein
MTAVKTVRPMNRFKMKFQHGFIGVKGLLSISLLAAVAAFEPVRGGDLPASAQTSL